MGGFFSFIALRKKVNAGSEAPKIWYVKYCPKTTLPPLFLPENTPK